MRESNLSRLSSIRLKGKDQYYIHLYFLLKDIKDALKQHASGYLLDIGCGNKPYEEWYLQYSNKQTGCDIIQSDGNRVDVICPATELAFGDNTFDTAFCTQVLEHVYDHHKVLAEANRVLKPGGKLIVTVPFCWELHEEPYDFFRITKHGLQELCNENNFKVLYIKSNGGKWAAAFQMFINTVYSSFRFKTVRSKIVKFFFIELRLTWLLNKLAVWIDNKYFDDVWTLNYILVAEKK